MSLKQHIHGQHRLNQTNRETIPFKEYHHQLRLNGAQAEVGVESSGIIVHTSTGLLRLKWGQIAEFRYRENKFTIVTKTRDRTLIIISESTQKGKAP